MREATCAALVLLAIVGCSSSKSPEQAQKELSDLGIPFDANVFNVVAARCDTVKPTELSTQPQASSEPVKSIKVVESFVAAGMPPDGGLVSAARGQCLETVRSLIGKVKNQETILAALAEAVKPNTAVQVGSIPPNKDLVRILVDKIENKEYLSIPLYSAVSTTSADKDTVQVLLDKGASPSSIVSNAAACINQNSCSVLTRSLAAGNVEIAKILIDKGANINDGQKGGSQSLSEAITRDHVEIVKVLLVKGACPVPGEESYLVDYFTKERKNDFTSAQAEEVLKKCNSSRTSGANNQFSNNQQPSNSSEQEKLNNPSWQVVPGAEVGRNAIPTQVDTNNIVKNGNSITFDITGYQGFYFRLEGDCSTKQIRLLQRGMLGAENTVTARPIEGGDDAQVRDFHHKSLDFACNYK